MIECYSISGEFDFMLKVVCSDMNAYYDFHVNKLSSIENIGNVQSVFVMGRIKETHEVVHVWFFISITFVNLLSCNFCLSLFCLSKKVTKKGPPKKITSLFRDCTLIKLLCYCSFNRNSLIYTSKCNFFSLCFFCARILKVLITESAKSH